MFILGSLVEAGTRLARNPPTLGGERCQPAYLFAIEVPPKEKMDINRPAPSICLFLGRISFLAHVEGKSAIRIFVFNLPPGTPEKEFKEGDTCRPFY